MNSWLYLVFFSLRRQLRPRRLVVALILFLVLAVLVGTRGLIDPWKITVSYTHLTLPTKA